MEPGTIQGIVDWEASGFYPAYRECVKATNNLEPNIDFDWYNFLHRRTGFPSLD